MYDDYEPVEYYIPVNLEDDGNLFGGNIKKKNLVETVVIFLVTMMVWVVFTYPFGMTIKIIVFVAIPLPLTALAVVGINNESFVEYVLEVFFFRKKQRVAKFRLPMNIPYEEEKLRIEQSKAPKEESVAEASGNEKLSRKERKAQKKQAKQESKRQKKIEKLEKKYGKNEQF